MDWEKKYKTLERQMEGFAYAIKSDIGKKELGNSQDEALVIVIQCLAYAYGIEEIDSEDKNEINKYCIENARKFNRRANIDIVLHSMTDYSSEEAES